MSFAIIQTGGKQYKVSASKIIEVEKLHAEKGKIIQFKNVLLLNDNKTTEIGNPNISGAIVEAKLLENVKDRTVLVFHKRRIKNSRKKKWSQTTTFKSKNHKNFFKRWKNNCRIKIANESKTG